MKHPRPHIKRHIRDPLARWPKQVPVALCGPVGVGKRTLGQKLPQTHIETTHRRVRPIRPQRSIRLHPLTVTELGLKHTEQFITLMGRGGFPERIWPTPDTEPSTTPQHLNDLLSRVWRRKTSTRQRGAPTKTPDDPRAFLDALMRRIGQPLSTHSLASAFGVSHPTMARWIDELEDHHGLFRLKPLSTSTQPLNFRPIKKDQKSYPYDWSLGSNNPARLEALVAVHLLAWVETGVDVFDRPLTLHYLRDCDQREVDFVVLDSGVPILLVQCEPSIARPSPHLVYFQKKCPKAQAWHLSLEQPRSTQTVGSVIMAHPLDFLQRLDLGHSRQISPNPLE